MKHFKLTAVATALAFSSLASAELVSLDEESLEEVTGQSGITIETELGDVSIHYLDADGATVSGSASNGGIITLDLETVTINDTTGAVAANAGSVVVDIDVVSDTPDIAGQNALRVATSFNAPAGSTSYLHVSDLGIRSTTSNTTTGNTAFGAALVETATSSMGDIYVEIGDTTMYVYGH